MRHSLNLPQENLTALGSSESLTPEFVAAHPLQSLGSPHGNALLCLRMLEDTFEAAVLVTNFADPAQSPQHPEWWAGNHAVFFFDPAHDHATRWMFALPEGQPPQTTCEWVAPGEAFGESVSKSIPPAWTHVEHEFKRLDAQRFFARVLVRAPQFRRSDRTPIGFEVKVGLAAPQIHPALVWPQAVPWAANMPLQFGDVYRESTFSLDALELPAPVWSARNELRVRGLLHNGAPDRGYARLSTILPGDAEKYEVEAPWKHARQKSAGPLELKLPVHFSPRAKWSNDLLLTARLRLELADAEHNAFWSAEYPFGFDCGIIVRERYGPLGAPNGTLAPRPTPTVPNFLEEFRQYIYQRIPDYRAKSTRSGAPSDFYLEDPFGQASVNLSDPHWPDFVAQDLASRFPLWEDALCAIAAWIHHPHVTRHSASWARISGLLSTASVPRVDGCFCCDTARIGALLAEKLGAKMGIPLKGFSLGLRGHLATLVETPRGAVVIDGMVGYWFHTLDNTRLATLEEMRADARMAGRVWYCPHAHGHEFFFGVHNQMIHPYEDTAYAWPESLSNTGNT